MWENVCANHNSWRREGNKTPGRTKSSYRKLHLFNFSLPRVRPQEARMIRDSIPSCSSQDPSALANLPAPGPVEERHSITQTNNNKKKCE